MALNRQEKWKNSLLNLAKVVSNLDVSLSSPITEQRDLSGIIKDFELAYELSWKVLRTLLTIKGHETEGARDVFKKCYQLGILNDEEIWLSIIEDRNATVHTYDETKAKQMVERIRKSYQGAFDTLLQKCRSESVD